MSSDDDPADLLAAFKRNESNPSIPAAPPRRKEASVSPEMVVEESSARGQEKTSPHKASSTRMVAVAVRVPPVRNREEYTYYEPKDEVEQIRREYSRRGKMMYEVKLTDGKLEQFTFDKLLSTKGGSTILQKFEQQDLGPSEDDSPRSRTEASEMRPRRRRNHTKPVHNGMVDSSVIDVSSDELATTARKSGQRRLLEFISKRDTERGITVSDSSEDSENGSAKRRRRGRPKAQEPVRRSRRSRAPVQEYDEYDEEEEDEDDSSGVEILRSDLIQGRKTSRPVTGRLEKAPRQGVRQSDRATRAKNNMQEANIDDIYRSESEPQNSPALKIVAVREVFQTLPRSNLFRSRHVEGCEVCSDGPSIAPLIYCQGCSLAYHKNCLGNRSSRDHLVTKVSDDNFVLQCRRCINIYMRKDSLAPDLAKCQDCTQLGPACKTFKARKTPQQEQKERDENGGQDPVVDVPSNLVNNAQNVLFRCTHCWRAYHYHHLPPLSQYSMVMDRDEEETADDRFQEYSKKWLCKDCHDTEKLKVSGLIAWRPSDLENFQPGTLCNMLSEDDKQYLIKWADQSYFQASWHSGAWTWGVTAAGMRKAFYKREDGPKMRTEDAIPEEFLRIDIVLEVKYTSYVEIGSEEIDKARIKEVDKALIKYKGLGYEDAVWEKVPTPEDGDRWLDFVTAYNDWVAGRYIKYPKLGPLKSRLEKVRGAPFSKLEKTKQPENLVGGELMKYQIEGLNWLYYQWHNQTNGILADEMGLGKTIQVIGFMATLIQEHNCFPFLVVVPNSTCANWRREIKHWAPSLRVVTYFGSAAARDMAYKYEMFPQGQKDLRCHIVVTSYEAATDDSSRFKLRRITWAGLIVDEGQRLKNDKSQLYSALTAVKAPFRLLLTGTPLQNNARELFNLLQFLDDTINAAELEEKYTDMTTAENIRELHDQIRPFILRRTKAQVLTFLPPLGQIIVPLSMSVLQKTLYKSILAKNPQLLKALFVTQKQLRQQERANLSNILMQLRKCLCHPFVYSREIEERTDLASVSHRNLVEASAKLQFLELMLPKLQERGHRVLIFSQFLDMLSIIEDFLDGLQMTYQRLDGTMGSLEKQKRIDQFNEPDSPLFAFLLSTRAGGVGINLATADTVIILDPDFNPHQDLQAISRAHRIGQKKKVLCFQLTTRASAEEKITQMGRKKMALDHVVVEQLDAEDLEDEDVESILKYGAAELFKDDAIDHDIRYDEASIEKLLDRTQMENTKTAGDDSAESQFSFARVWANDEGALQDNLDTTEDAPPDPGVWDKILKERQEAAAVEAMARANALGRGKRTRMAIDYTTELDVADAADTSPIELMTSTKKKQKTYNEYESDTDFQVEQFQEEDEDEDSVIEADDDTAADAATLENPEARRGSTAIIDLSSQYKQNGAGGLGSRIFTFNARSERSHNVTTTTNTSSANGHKRIGHSQRNNETASTPKPIPTHHNLPVQVANKIAVRPFQRVQMPVRSPFQASSSVNMINCYACMIQHPRGACPLKVAGVEHCGLCGLAHYGHGRTCPHIKSETQVRAMLEALKSSPENKELVDAAVKYLRGVKGTLVQQKKKKKEKAIMRSEGRDSNQSPQLAGPSRPHASQPLPHPFQTSYPVAPQQMQNATNRHSIENHDVESALQGFLTQQRGNEEY